jgi:hypothetical protein
MKNNQQAMEAPMDETPQPRLEQQLFEEAGAMARHAIAAGLTPDPEVMSAIARYEATAGSTTGSQPNAQLDGLLHAHMSLARLVDPAKPRTILMLAREQKKTGPLRILGPIPLIRQMMGAALISLCLFILLGLSPHVNPDGGNILHSDGLPLLLNLLFFLAAAGLGASFQGLYKANAYLTKGNFDSTYIASYWIRFFLGLIAGLFLSVLISDKAFQTAGHNTGMLEEGVVRPLLAMLGGFSANLGYTILSRLVETIESLFRGSTKQLIENSVHQERLQMEGQVSQQQVQLMSELVQLRAEMASNPDPESVQQSLGRIIAELMPAREKSADRKPRTD